MEQPEQKYKSVNEIYRQLTACEPRLFSNFVPEKQSSIDQKTAFLAGSVRNPHHLYDKLAQVDFEGSLQTIRTTGAQLLDHADMNPKHAIAYEQFIDNYTKKTRLGELANLYNLCTDVDTKQQIKTEYLELNIELYGEPDKATYRSLLKEKITLIDSKQLDGTGQRLKDELHGMIDGTLDGEVAERFRPSQETVEWMHKVTETLYGSMLSHISKQEMFTVIEIEAVFRQIIESEFGEAAEGWTIDIEPAASINVKSSEKRIVIPIDLKDQSYKMMRELVVHEIGVHMLRAVMGGETDVDPLANGLDDYYDAEEGLGSIMAQADRGTYKEATGVDHYITVGAAYFDEMDFRDTFEMKWRIAVLESAKDGVDITEAAIAKAKNTQYAKTRRIFRGTDELPWFKDLAYYNGSSNMWRYLEEIRGDDLRFMFVLLGKADPSKHEHQQIQYEARTV